jgi:hypothetical protein
MVYPYPLPDPEVLCLQHQDKSKPKITTASAGNTSDITKFQHFPPQSVTAVSVRPLSPGKLRNIPSTMLSKTALTLPHLPELNPFIS